MKNLDPRNDIQTVEERIFSAHSCTSASCDWERWPPGGDLSMGIAYAPTGTSDYSFLVTIGWSRTTSLYALSGSTLDTLAYKYFYDKYAQMLLPSPYDTFKIGDRTLSEVIFIDFWRSIKQDELKKGATRFSFDGSYGISGTYYLWTDVSASNKYQQNLNSDYAYLQIGCTGSGSCDNPYGYDYAGIVYYQAGVIILDPYALLESGSNSIWSGSQTLYQMFSQSAFGRGDVFINAVTGFSNRFNYLNWNDQLNVYETCYFVRAHAKEFNYSSNPTFVDSSGSIRIMSGSAPSNRPNIRTYVTTIGFYDDSDNLLAVAKPSHGVKKDFSNERVFKVVLAY